MYLRVKVKCKCGCSYELSQPTDRRPYCPNCMAVLDESIERKLNSLFIASSALTDEEIANLSFSLKKKNRS